MQQLPELLPPGYRHALFQSPNPSPSRSLAVSIAFFYLIRQIPTYIAIVNLTMTANSITNWFELPGIFSIKTFVLLTIGPDKLISKIVINLFLSFSNNLINKGLESLLTSAGDIRVHSVQRPGELSDAIIEKKPDVLIVDFFVLINFLPDLTGAVKVLLLDTGCSTDNVNYAFISKHISGLIAADADETTLAKAVRCAARGNLWIGRKEIKNLITFLTGLTKFRKLTAMEMEILCLIGKGMDENSVSRILFLKRQTVKNHIRKIKEKSGTNDIYDLAGVSLQLSDSNILQYYMELINQEGPIEICNESLPPVQEGFLHK
jgi:DNA-binding NarL/FixJ family response regulator